MCCFRTPKSISKGTPEEKKKTFERIPRKIFKKFSKGAHGKIIKKKILKFPRNSWKIFGKAFRGNLEEIAGGSLKKVHRPKFIMDFSKELLEALWTFFH